MNTEKVKMAWDLLQRIEPLTEGCEDGGTISGQEIVYLEEIGKLLNEFLSL